MFDTEIAKVSNTKVLDQIGYLADGCLRKDIKQRPEMKDVAERLRKIRKVHSQHGQEKPVQWSLWGTDKAKQSASSSSSSSNSTVFFKLNSWSIFPETQKITNIYTRKQLKQITSNYKYVITEGTFGKVYRGTLEDKQLVAVKQSINVGMNVKKEMTDEVIIQSELRHKNIVRLLGCCLELDAPMLVCEFVARGSLYDILFGHNDSMSVDTRLGIAIGTAEGLTYMHSAAGESTIRHGDIKSTNILLDEYFTPKISEFGTSMLLGKGKIERTECVIGDMNYIDPVYMKEGIVTEKSDVYSFGIVLIELITRRPATYGGRGCYVADFVEATVGKRARDHFDSDITSQEDIKLLEMVSEVVVECLKSNPEERPEMKEVGHRLLHIVGKSAQHDQEKHRPGNIGILLEKLNNCDISPITPIMTNIYTKKQLRQITSNYQHVIAEGFFCKVYKGTLENNERVAVKKSVKVTKDMKTTLTAEVIIESEMRHKNIIRLLGCCLDQEVPMLVYEFVASGSLYDVLFSSKDSILVDTRLGIAIGSAEGLTYIHSAMESIIRHGYVTSANILLDENLTPKISDFMNSTVLAKGESKKTECVIGDMNYIDPVYMMEGIITEKSDVYSFGIVLIELITRRPATYDEKRSYVADFVQATLDKEARHLFDTDVTMEDDIKLLEMISAVAVECLQPSPEERPEMRQVRQRLLYIAGQSAQHDQEKHCQGNLRPSAADNAS